VSFIVEGRLKLMGVFHNKETPFVVFCSKLVFLNTDLLLLNTVLFLTIHQYIKNLDD